MAVIEGSETLVGRDGLQLPPIQSRWEQFEGFDAMRFFGNFWALNGQPAFNNYRNVGHLENTAARLVLPHTADKPLVVVESSLVATSSEHRQADKERSRLASGGNSTTISTAKERHALLGEPEKTGNWVPLVEVTYTHRSYRGPGASAHVDQPSIRDGSSNIYPINSTPERIQLGMEVEDYGRFAEQRYSDAVKLVLEKALSLLS